jgi:septal ring-binding cell division protein DamX
MRRMSQEATMQLARKIMLGMVAGAVLVAAGCATTTRPAGLSQAAEQLDLNSQALAARSDTVGPPYQPDAHELAHRAHEFRSMVDTPVVSREDVAAQFNLVEDSYQKVRADAEHARTQQVYADLEPVTAAYRDVQYRMGITPGPGTSG